MTESSLTMIAVTFITLTHKDAFCIEKKQDLVVCTTESWQPYQPPIGLWSGERVRGSDLPPNEIPVGVEKAKAGFPLQCKFGKEHSKVSVPPTTPAHPLPTTTLSVGLSALPLVRVCRVKQRWETRLQSTDSSLSSSSERMGQFHAHLKTRFLFKGATDVVGEAKVVEGAVVVFKGMIRAIPEFTSNDSSCASICSLKLTEKLMLLRAEVCVRLRINGTGVNVVVLKWNFKFSVSKMVYLGHPIELFDHQVVKVNAQFLMRENRHKGIPSRFVKALRNPRCPDHWLHSTKLWKGANQHITNSTKNMFNIVDVTELKLTVGHPNGTLAQITHVGSLRLNNDVVLFDVLVVPEYCVSLLSVHKLIKDNKLVVMFDECKCHIQDLKRGRVLGTGSEFGGLDVKFYETVFPYKMSSSKTGFENEKVYDVSSLFFYFVESETTPKTSSPNDEEECTSGRDGSMHQPDKRTLCLRAILSLSLEVPVFQNVPEVQTKEVSLRRSKRSSKLPDELNDYVLDKKVKYGLNMLIPMNRS
ncbi:hypothetical protein Tco_0051190 [Tanacetum coccineum]